MNYVILYMFVTLNIKLNFEIGSLLHIFATASTIDENLKKRDIL